MRTTRRVVVGRWVVLGVSLGSLLAAGVGSGGPDRRAQAQAETLGGRWQTHANGDDVLALQRADGYLWSGTRAGGLVRWDLESGAYRQFLRPQDPLGGNTVFDIAVDGSGRLWLATDGGLTVFEGGSTLTEADDRWFTYTTENGLGMPSDEVRAVAAGGNVVWVGGVQRQDVRTGDYGGGGIGRVDTKGTFDPEDDSWAPIVTFESTYVERPDGTSEPGLVSDSVNDLLVTPQGNLWVAASPHWRYEQSADPESGFVWQREHGGMSFLDTKGTDDPADDRWTSFSCELLELTVTCTVRRLAIDPRGRGWAADGGRGLIHFDVATGQLGGPQARLVPPTQEGDGFVLDMAFGPIDVPALANTVWLATRGGGVAVLDHRGTLANKSDDVWNFDRGGPFGTGDGLSGNRVQAIVPAGGAMWLGHGQDRGVGGGLQPLDMSAETVGTALRTVQAPPSNFVTDIAFGETGTRWDGHVWLATGTRGGATGARLFGSGVVDWDTRGTADLGDDVWTRHTASTSDDDGDLPWSGLAGDNVQALLVEGDNVWFGAAETIWDRDAGRYADGGLSVYDGVRWTARAPSAGPGSGPGRGGVSSLEKDCDGRLWVGTGNQWDNIGSGVFVLDGSSDPHDPATDAWTRHAFPSLASANTTAIAADCEGRVVWVSAMHHVNTSDTGGPIGQWSGGGLAAYAIDAGTWTKHIVQPGAGGFDSFASGDITGEAATVATDGPTVLAGTFGTEQMDASDLVAQRPYWPAVLNRYDGSSWVSERFERSGVLASVAVDGEGRQWAATSRGGMARSSISPDNWQAVDPEGGLFVSVDGAWLRLAADADGIPSNDVTAVRVAPDGNVWIATSGWGIARFDPRAAPPTPTPTLRLPTRTPSPTRDPNEPTPTRSSTRVPTIPPPRPSPTGVGSATPPRPGVDQSYLPAAFTHGWGPPRPPLDEHAFLPIASKGR